MVPLWLHREHPVSFIHSSHAVCALLVCPFFRNNEKMMDGQCATLTGRTGSPQASILETLTQSIIECVLILRWGCYSDKDVGVSPFRATQSQEGWMEENTGRTKARRGRWPAEEGTNARRPDLRLLASLALSAVCSQECARHPWASAHPTRHNTLCSFSSLRFLRQG